MKYLYSIAITLCLLPFMAAGTVPCDTLRVLAIGNSFSLNAVEQNLHEIAEADGVTLIIGNMYIPGCSLERHWNNSRNGSTDYEYRKIGKDGIKVNTPGVDLETALKDEKWDFVSLQQCSNFSGKPDSYEPYTRDLVKFVRKRTRKGCTLLWHQTWAYSLNANHPAYPLYDRSQKQMYSEIMEASKGICEKYGFRVVPSGTAIQNTRTTFNRDNITRDGYHLNRLGEYVAALTWYETLSGRTVIGNSYKPDCIMPEYARMAQASAHAAVLSPYATDPELGFAPTKDYRDESHVPEYSLPDIMEAVHDREGLLDKFATEMYGKAPERPSDEAFKVVEESRTKDGLAIRKKVKIDLGGKSINLLLYIPADAKGPVPVFVGLNFWEKNLDRISMQDAIEKGNLSSRWPIHLILCRGYGVATWAREDVWADTDSRSGNEAPDSWGAVAKWAWSMSRVLDYLETDRSVDPSGLIAIGFSRLGKAAMWAAACDKRFAMAVSNESGCCGAAISRRKYGETVRIINEKFPYWFCGNFRKYDDNESCLPFDQHQLLALIAPRPIYVASAINDQFSDPKGEFLSLKLAGEVYRHYGFEGIGNADCPAVNTPVFGDRAGYHIRSGAHEMTSYDWEQYLNFADRYLKKKR